MEKKVYFDNAATTFPKPESVSRAVCGYIDNIGCNVSRGSYAGAYEAQEMLFETRSRLKRLFNAPDEKNVIFTPSDTYSLNMLIKGIMRPDDLIATDTMGHNASVRPICAITGSCAETRNSDSSGYINERVLTIECDGYGTISPEALACRLEECLREAGRQERAFRALVMTHGSNVCGSILPIETAGRFCRDNGIYFIVDAAQTAGIEDIDVEKMCIDGLCFSGHKSLYGPQGTGGFVVSDRMAAGLKTLIEGGTGSFSHMLEMPERLPERFEAGTMNIPGIYGLNAGLRFVEEKGVSGHREHTEALTRRFISLISDIDGIRVVGIPDSYIASCAEERKKGTEEHITGEPADKADVCPRAAERRLPVVSVTCDIMDEAQLAFRLEEEYGIWTRVGLHCAPCAHRTLGTFPKGTVRFSFGAFNTEEEIEYGAQAIGSICKRG